MHISARRVLPGTIVIWNVASAITVPVTMGTQGTIVILTHANRTDGRPMEPALAKMATRVRFVSLSHVVQLIAENTVFVGTITVHASTGTPANGVR